MKKILKKYWKSLRRDYDFDTTSRIENKIIKIYNDYTKKHNLKGWEKKYVNSDIQFALWWYYSNNGISGNLSHYLFARYDINPNENVMCVNNILLKFGSAEIEKRKHEEKMMEVLVKQCSL